MLCATYDANTHVAMLAMAAVLVISLSTSYWHDRAYKEVFR